LAIEKVCTGIVSDVAIENIVESIARNYVVTTTGEVRERVKEPMQG